MSLNYEEVTRLKMLIAQNECARTLETYRRIQNYLDSLTDRSNNAPATDEAEAYGYDPDLAAQ